MTRPGIVSKSLVLLQTSKRGVTMATTGKKLTASAVVRIIFLPRNSSREIA